MAVPRMTDQATFGPSPFAPFMMMQGLTMAAWSLTVISGSALDADWDDAASDADAEQIAEQTAFETQCRRFVCGGIAEAARALLPR